MQEHANGEISYVSKLIGGYYKGATEFAPDRVERREFGVGDFQTKIRYRHLSFPNEAELRKYLSDKAVPYVSYSTAYYKFPGSRPMDAKGWLGSELVFDLDANDMKIPCQLSHGKSWVCDDCLKAVKGEALKLVEDFLVPDFGFSEKEIEVNFSGNRGYHIHVKEDSILELNADARREISDYISGNGMGVEEFFPTSGRRGVKLTGPKPTDKGWQGKIARNFIANLNKGEDSLINLGINKSIAKNLFRKRALIEMGIRNGNWDMVYIKNKADFWKTILQNQAIAQSDRIDGNVTRDPSHLIRLPNSVHAGTGLIAKRVRSLNELCGFDPMSDAIAFRKGELTAKANSRYEIVMNKERFGPYKEEEVTLPVYAGIYLYLKGLARININT